MKTKAKKKTTGSEMLFLRISNFLEYSLYKISEKINLLDNRQKEMSLEVSSLTSAVELLILEVEKQQKTKTKKGKQNV